MEKGHLSIEKDDLQEDKLTPEELSRLLPDRMNVDMVVLQFPNSKTLAKVFGEKGVGKVIYFDYKEETQEENNHLKK